MACITEVVPLSLQDRLGYQAMPEVTILTLPFFDDCMNIFHREVLVRELGVTVQAVFTSARFSLYGRGA
jgi:hypothetical protein